MGLLFAENFAALGGDVIMCDEVSYYAVNFCIDKTSANLSGNLPFPVLCSSGSLHYPYGSLFQKATLESGLKNDGSDYLVNGILPEMPYCAVFRTCIASAIASNDILAFPHKATGRQPQMNKITIKKAISNRCGMILPFSLRRLCHVNVGGI